MGGRLALYIAVRQSSVVRSLTLVSATAGLANTAKRQARRAADEALAARIERDGVASFVAEWERNPLFAGLAGLPEEAWATLHEQRLSNSPLGLANSLRGMGAGAQPSNGRLAGPRRRPVGPVGRMRRGRRADDRPG